MSILKSIKYNLFKLIDEMEYEYIDFYNFGINQKILNKAGFELNKYNKDIIIPNYFEPFLQKNIKLYYVSWPKKTSFPIFKGDGDQDRPNFI